jgi:hypothetical protein
MSQRDMGFKLDLRMASLRPFDTGGSHGVPAEMKDRLRALMERM